MSTWLRDNIVRPTASQQRHGLSSRRIYLFDERKADGWQEPSVTGTPPRFTGT